MHIFGMASESPLTSNELVHRCERWFKQVFLLFGEDRVFFESNFPMDKATSSYVSFWNAAKKMAFAFSDSPLTRRKLLFENANKVYRLQQPLPELKLYTGLPRPSSSSAL